MISVVIPTYNEEKALGTTLDHLFAQQTTFEVLVVDGGSTDQTLRIASAYSGIRILKAAKGRASQMNVGASWSTGEWLMFLHADTQLAPDALASIEALGEEIQAGGFRHRFSGKGRSLRVISLVDNLRCRITRVIYGDQAMFVRRSLFEKLGGFPNQPILEDVAFCRRLVKCTRPLLMDGAVITDPRKFVHEGVWRSLARVIVILLYEELGVPIPAWALKFFQDVR